VDCAADLDGSLIAPTVDKTMSSDERVAAVKSVLQDTTQPRMATMFDAKEQYKVLCKCCGIVAYADCMDPKVACWLLDPSSNDRNLHCLVTNYCPLEAHLLQGWSAVLHSSHYSTLCQLYTASFYHSGTLLPLEAHLLQG